MSNIVVPTFIVVDKTQPKRIVAILDQAFAPWWTQNLPIFDVIEAQLSFGKLTNNNGTFEYFHSKEGHFFLTEKPSHLSLGEAYDYLFKDV